MSGTPGPRQADAAADRDGSLPLRAAPARGARAGGCGCDARVRLTDDARVRLTGASSTADQESQTLVGGPHKRIEPG